MDRGGIREFGEFQMSFPGWAEREKELISIFVWFGSRIGDLRLQALTSYSTFKDTQLAKRCLYLHAGVPFADGRVSSFPPTPTETSFQVLSN